MLRKPGSHYENKRSSTLLKVKTFYDEEALVVGHKPGKGNFTGVLGALQCKLPNGKRFDAGSGLNMDQRRKPPKIGSVITFKFQELSNAGIPRFPVFLRLRTDLTWKDVLEAAKTKKPMSVKEKVVPSAKLSKQHSILFSVIPSRDAKTGKKIVTSDDEDEEATASATASSSSSKTKAKLTKTKSKTKTPGTIGAKSTSRNPVDPDELIESDELASPTTTDNLLVKDKNKGRKLDDDDDDDGDADDDQESNTRNKTNKRKRNLEEKSKVKPTGKRVKKS